jgi:hypothetical protein
MQMSVKRKINEKMLYTQNQLYNLECLIQNESSRVCLKIPKNFETVEVEH